MTFDACLGVQSQGFGSGRCRQRRSSSGVESGSPAEKGGAQGDVITQDRRYRSSDSTTLGARIRQSAPGTVLQLTVERNGSPRTLTVTLGSTSATYGERRT